MNAAIPTPPHLNATSRPLLCFTGVQIGTLSPVGEATVCYGVCASLTVTATIADSVINATVYACESRAVCDVFQVTNDCATLPASVLGSTVRGCCCNDHMCNDPSTGGVQPMITTLTPATSTTTSLPPATLHCYAGFTVKTGPTTYYTVGDTLLCNGQCSNLTLPVGATNVTFLMCDPFELCQPVFIGIVDRCR